MALSFASSDGWMPSPPIANQRRALLTGGLNSTSDERDEHEGRAMDQMKTGSR